MLVHCYAGQSRSAALVIAHLMAARQLGLVEAWALTRAARPCAQPNSGFLRQLEAYRHALDGNSGSDDGCDAACAAPACDAAPLEAADSAAELVLTQ